MNFKKCNLLTEAQVRQIRALERACHQQDSTQNEISLCNDINFTQEINSFYFLFDGDTLVSFLSLFFPTQREAEISAVTHPAHRGQGCFRTLLQQAKEEMKPFHIPRLLFVHEPQSAAGKTVLTHYGAELEFSEYLMEYDKTAFAPQPAALRLARVSRKTLPAVAQLNAKVFDSTVEESLSMVEKSLDSPDIACYGAFLEGALAGICNVNFEGDEVSIFGVGIDPELQGKGYGRQLLNLVLQQTMEQSEKPITLEVDSTNDTAFRLYRTSGFGIKTQYDYYALPLLQ